MNIGDAHDTWDELLPEYAAGQIGGIERERIVAHLTTCPQCQHELERLHALAIFLTREDPDAPSDRTFEAGWHQLAASLPPRESVTATVHGERALSTLDVGEYQGSEISSRSLLLAASTKRKGAQWRDMVRLVATLAALVTIVGSLALIGLHQVAIPVPTCTSLPHDKVVPTSTPPAPNDKRVLTSTPPAPTGLPNGTVLDDIAMVSATEGWAAGSIVELDPIKDDYVDKQTLILHYQCGTWTVLPDSLPHLQFLHFWTPAPGELWVWGLPLGQLDTVFLKYQNGHWKQSAPPMPLPTRADSARFVVSQIHSRAKDDIWAAGSFAGSAPSDAKIEGQTLNYGRLMLWHYNGSGWTSVPNVNVAGEIAPAAPDEAWVLAEDPSSLSPIRPRVVLHVIHGVATVGLSAGRLENSRNVTVISPTDVWASGETILFNGTTPTNKSKAVLYHYDGVSWTRSTIQIPSNITNITITGHDTLLGFTYDAVQDKRFGQIYSITQAFVYRDAHWQRVPWSIHQMLAEYGLRVTSAGDDIWAIGTYLIVWSTRNHGGIVPDLDGEGSVLLHYTNGAWTQYGS